MSMTCIEKALAIPFVLEDIIDLYDQSACQPSARSILISPWEDYCIYRGTSISNVVPGQCRSSHVKALVKLQRVSRVWQAVTTRLLWRSYAQAANLRAMMASDTSLPIADCWSENGRYYWSSNRIFRSNTPQWHVYSRYIRIMCLTTGFHDSNHQNFFTNLLPFLRNVPLLLPSLHTLFISGDWLNEAFAVQNLTLLLSPVMRHLELTFPGDEESDSSLTEDCLNTIATQAPYLRLLRVSNSAYREEEDLGEDFSPPLSFAMLAGLADLEYFGFPSNWASDSLLQILSSQPKLRLLDMQYDDKLSFSTHRSIEATKTSTPASSSCKTHTYEGEGRAKRCFPVLEDFLLHLSLQISQNMFPSRVPYLDDIDKLSVTLQDQEQLECCRNLTAQFAHIKDLKLCPPKFGVVEPDCLLELEGYRSLTCLDVRGIDFQTGLDYDMATLFRSWPNLKTLILLAVPGSKVLETYHGVGMEALSAEQLVGLELKTLGHAASNLKQLEMLEVTLVASSTKSLLYPPKEFQRLKALKLEDSFLNFQVEDFDLLDAGRYISSLFKIATPPGEPPKITFLEDSTLPPIIADYISLYEKRSRDEWCSDRWIMLKGYDEDYLEFHRSLLIDIFSRLDARAHQGIRERDLHPDGTDEQMCPFCSKLRQLEEDSCCDSQSDSDSTTDSNWDSSDDSGDETDESIADKSIT